MESGQVTLVDVTLRDGLQDQPRVVSTEDKVMLAELLVQAGYRELEVTSFMRPDWIPQTADAERVLKGFSSRPGVQRHVLVPNRRGLDRALTTDAEVLTFVISASTAHNQRNLNRTTDESLAQVAPLIEEAKRAGKWVRGTVSTAFGCTIQGPIAPNAVWMVVDRYLEAGVDQVCLADTVGLATPKGFNEVMERVLDGLSPGMLGLHLHEGAAVSILTIVQQALDMGLRVFDSAIAGLGGCPFAPGAKGNLKAERLIPYLEARGFATGIDSGQLPTIALTLGMALGDGPLVTRRTS
ncbi:MAG: hydroxymethylglutaryl-CoA lyase [Firmicutes bacterium]|nr:hydroxymethylglutaryl-CoA lyase [Bacillota bacterium]